MFTTIPNVFQDLYHFELQYTGLAYLGCKFTNLKIWNKSYANTKTKWVLACL